MTASVGVVAAIASSESHVPSAPIADPCARHALPSPSVRCVTGIRRSLARNQSPNAWSGLAASARGARFSDARI